VAPEAAVHPPAAVTLVSVASGTRRIPASALIAFFWARLDSPGESTIFFVPLILTSLINCHGNLQGLLLGWLAAHYWTRIKRDCPWHALLL